MKTTYALAFSALGLFSLARTAKADGYYDDRPPRREHFDIALGADAVWYHPDPTTNTDSFGGFGVSVRHRLDERVSVEATGAFFQPQAASATNPYSVRAYPIQASVIGYLYPRSPLQLYGLAGLGVESSDVTDESTGDSWHFTRPGGHMGVGAQMNVDRLTFQMDYRWIVYSNPNTTAVPPPPFTESSARMFRMGMSLKF